MIGSTALHIFCLEFPFIPEILAIAIFAAIIAFNGIRPNLPADMFWPSICLYPITLAAVVTKGGYGDLGRLVGGLGCGLLGVVPKVRWDI